MVAGSLRLILAYIADAPGLQHDVHLGAPRGAHMCWTPCWRVRVEAQPRFVDHLTQAAL
jgi:hypothetical protein